MTKECNIAALEQVGLLSDRVKALNVPLEKSMIRHIERAGALLVGDASSKDADVKHYRRMAALLKMRIGARKLVRSIKKHEAQVIDNILQSTDSLANLAVNRTAAASRFNIA